MINAIISSKVMGFNNGVPFISMAFAIKGDSEDNSSATATVMTSPISLVKNGESLMNSAMAYTIGLVLEVVGVQTWEDLLGKAVQIELDENNNIISIANILDNDKYITLMTVPNEEEASEEAKVADEA